MERIPLPKRLDHKQLVFLRTWQAQDMTEDKHSNAVDHYIDESLRRVYQDVLEEDVPERFKKLLDRLKSGEQQGGLGEKAE